MRMSRKLLFSICIIAWETDQAHPEKIWCVFIVLSVCVWEKELGEKEKWRDDVMTYVDGHTKEVARTEKRNEQSGLSVSLTFPWPIPLTPYPNLNKSLCCHLHLFYKQSLSPGLLKTAFIPKISLCRVTFLELPFCTSWAVSKILSIFAYGGR